MMVAMNDNIVVSSSNSATTPVNAVDRLSALLERFRVHAALFHTGRLCGRQRFEVRPGRAFLHVLRRGAMEVRHRPGETSQTRLRLHQPTLLLYPRPLHHEFINPPQEGSDLTCSTLDFDGGLRHPIVSALPALVHVPMAEVDGLRPALELLFDEADRARCGSRVLVDRLFEIVLIQLLRWIIDHPQRVGVSSGLIAGLSDPRLARALVALHQAPSEDWPLARMASVAGMSRSAFAAAFRQIVGTSPAAYLGDWRLSLAATQLRSGQSAKQVAAEFGYAGAASLSKAFKQRFGLGPREWLRRNAAASA